MFVSILQLMGLPFGALLPERPGEKLNSGRPAPDNRGITRIHENEADPTEQGRSAHAWQTHAVAAAARRPEVKPQTKPSAKAVKPSAKASKPAAKAKPSKTAKPVAKAVAKKPGAGKPLAKPTAKAAPAKKAMTKPAAKTPAKKLPAKTARPAAKKAVPAT